MAAGIVVGKASGNARVENIKVINSRVSTGNGGEAGFLIGSAEGHVTIKGSKVVNSVLEAGDNAMVGGIVGNLKEGSTLTAEENIFENVEIKAGSGANADMAKLSHAEDIDDWSFTHLPLWSDHVLGGGIVSLLIAIVSVTLIKKRGRLIRHIHNLFRKPGVDDKMILDLADKIGNHSNLLRLGIELEFDHTAMRAYQATNMVDGVVGFKGTQNMLFDWRMRTPRGSQIPKLAGALRRARFIELADQYLPDTT